MKAWEAKQHAEQIEAEDIEQNVLAVAHMLNSRHSLIPPTFQKQPGLACDQKLLPGVRAHWGRVYRCDTNPPDESGFSVCEGCRVAHYAQHCERFDRALVMARGARVPVCVECAAGALEDRNGGGEGCICDKQWTCFQCREIKLNQLAKARKENYRETTCGRCGEEGALVDHVDFCLCCQKPRVYLASS